MERGVLEGAIHPILREVLKIDVLNSQGDPFLPHSLKGGLAVKLIDAKPLNN